MEGIKRRREAAKLSQRDLACAVGVSQAAVAQWELGINYPTLDNLKKIAEALKCKPGDLL